MKQSLLKNKRIVRHVLRSENMKITVKLFAMLSKYTSSSTLTIEIPQGATVNDLIKKLALPLSEVFNCTINGQNADFNTKLKDGDTVGFYPYIGGG